MGTWAWGWFAVAALLPATWVCAQIRTPYQLLDQEPDNVYVPPTAPDPDQGINEGGVNFSLDITYLSHYIYRGIDQTTPPLRYERALQFDGELAFNLGKLPHPFIGLFANIFQNDPISRFEEVRPYAGLEWTIRPLTIAGGFTSYIFPNREGRDTQEGWARLTFDDSRLFHTERPFFSPYVYGAYDFDKYNGFYIEAGVKHDFVIEEVGVVLTAVGDVAYVVHNSYFRIAPLMDETGFQHYDVGLIASYKLNAPLHIPPRYGQWVLKGFLYYTNSIDHDLRANDRLWGGVTISFSY